MPNDHIYGEVRKQSAHTVQMNHRKNAVITGVLDVNSFHENEIVLKVDSGLLVIGGQGLHIGKLLLDDGRLDVDGNIDSLSYESPNRTVRRMLGWRMKEK